MNETAISTFIYLTDISYDYGLITRKTQIQRISNLYELNGFDSYDWYFRCENEESFSFDDNNHIEEDNDYNEFDLNKLGLANAFQINQELYSKDNELFFISGQQGKYCKWKFNEFDIDDKPSIPHGHGIQRRNFKLDPFRSLIFDINRGFDNHISKEDDDFIRYLWNNKDFRLLASSSIDYHINYLNKHPLYWSEYRGLVHDPKRLPRRRR